ncbi:hypothetical protein, partial [Streptomyces gossypiisoli]|uniref:hypothetical protein n=1 Tax=Streptomyces gossypiisoli TaxID=2748864 RepID=UPI001E2DB0E2
PSSARPKSPDTSARSSVRDSALQLVRRQYPHAEALDPDRISFTVTLRALVRTIGRTAPPARLLHDALREIHAHPLLTRRPRAKPRERKGTVALAKAITTRPPSKVDNKITTRAPRGN